MQKLFEFVMYLSIVLFVAMVITCTAALADQPKDRVAIIDTGFNVFMGSKGLEKKLCKDGHYDFSTALPIVGFDMIGHGTYVNDLIDKSSGRDDVCYLHYKVFGLLAAFDQKVLGKAILKAYRAGATVINMSLSHGSYSEWEKKVMKYVANRGVRFFISSGNDGLDMNKFCVNYPACYKGVRNMKVVGSTGAGRLVERYSNHGLKIDIYEYGTIEGIGRGTSFASPRAAGKFLRDKKKDD